MKDCVYMAVLAAALFVSCATAQQTDDLTVTLPTGKVVTFQSAEQKAKYLAVTARTRQPATVQPAAALQPVLGQGSKTLPLISLDATNQSSGRTEDYTWRTDYGSYDATFQQSVGVNVNLRNVSHAPASLNVRCTFFARDNVTNARVVFASLQKRFDLAANQEGHMAVDSPLIEHHDTNYAALGEKYLEGFRYEGWLVQVMPSDREIVIKQTASTSYLEDFASHADFAALLGDYRKKLQAP